MEIRIKNKNKIKESRGPELEQKWGILKYLSVEISFEKSVIIQGPTTRVSGALGQKLGYDTEQSDQVSRKPDFRMRHGENIQNDLKHI